jgi:hypothetical protein
MPSPAVQLFFRVEVAFLAVVVARALVDFFARAGAFTAPAAGVAVLRARVVVFGSAVSAEASADADAVRVVRVRFGASAVGVAPFGLTAAASTALRRPPRRAAAVVSTAGASAAGLGNARTGAAASSEPPWAGASAVSLRRRRVGRAVFTGSAGMTIGGGGGLIATSPRLRFHGAIARDGGCGEVSPVACAAPPLSTRKM